MKREIVILCMTACGICVAIDDYLLVKSTPFYHDEGYQELLSKERVNAWPLLYYNKPDLSILWPMIAASEDGNAVYPFYSWYYGDEFSLFWPASNFELGAGRHVPALAYYPGIIFTYISFSVQIRRSPGNAARKDNRCISLILLQQRHQQDRAADTVIRHLVGQGPGRLFYAAAEHGAYASQ